jgi:hypothetical protein
MAVPSPKSRRAAGSDPGVSTEVPDDPNLIPSDQSIGEYLRQKGYTDEQAEKIFNLAMLGLLQFGDAEVSEEEAQAYLCAELAAIPWRR